MIKTTLSNLLLFLCIYSSTLYGQIKNKCVDFNNTSTSIIETPNILALNNTTQFTFETWIYIDSWAENSKIFLQQADSNNKLELQLGSEATKRLYFFVNNSTETYSAIDNTGLTVGNWHHIAVSYNGTALSENMVSFYIDGVQVSEWYSNGQGTVATSTPTKQVNLLLALAVLMVNWTKHVFGISL